MKIDLPDTPEIPLETLAAALSMLGLVLDAVRQSDGTHRARWASEPIISQRCAEPGCARYPAVRLANRNYCGLHGRRRMEEDVL